MWLDPSTYMIARFMSFYKPGVTKEELTSAASGKDSDWDEKGVQWQSTTNAMKTPKRGLQRSDKAIITCRLPLWYRGVEHTF